MNSVTNITAVSRWAREQAKSIFWKVMFAPIGHSQDPLFNAVDQLPEPVREEAYHALRQELRYKAVKVIFGLIALVVVLIVVGHF